LHIVAGLVELHDGKDFESGYGWEAFRRGPGNYEVLLTAFSHEPAVIELTAVSTAQAVERPGGFPEPPVTAVAEHVVFEDGFATYFDVNISCEGHLIDSSVYFTATTVAAS
jgi:hypothetical protein